MLLRRRHEGAAKYSKTRETAKPVVREINPPVTKKKQSKKEVTIEE